MNILTCSTFLAIGEIVTHVESCGVCLCVLHVSEVYMYAHSYAGQRERSEQKCGQNCQCEYSRKNMKQRLKV